MRRLARLAALLTGSISLTACVKTVELRSSIEPAPTGAGRSSESAGVVCTPGLLSYREKSGFYAFELGEPLCGALVRSVEASYRSAQRADKPYKGQYGRVIQFYLHRSALDVRRMPDGAVRVSYSVGVAVETCGGRDLQPRARKLVTGNAVITRKDASKAEVVKEAAEAAVQQVADDTLRLLVAGLDGPRIEAPAGEPVPAAPAP